MSIVLGHNFAVKCATLDKEFIRLIEKLSIELRYHHRPRFILFALCTCTTGRTMALANYTRFMTAAVDLKPLSTRLHLYNYMNVRNLATDLFSLAPPFYGCATVAICPSQKTTLKELVLKLIFKKIFVKSTWQTDTFAPSRHRNFGRPSGRYEQKCRTHFISSRDSSSMKPEFWISITIKKIFLTNI